MGFQSTERSPPTQRQRVTQIQRYVFVILEGARPLAGGMRVALRGLETLVLGRGEARALRVTGATTDATTGATTAALDVPDARMSASHARIVWTGAAHVIEDAGSTNGTLVNGEPVASHALRDGEVIELGQTILQYREIDEEDGPGPRGLDASALAGREPGFATLDPRLARSLDRLARVAPSPLSVLLLGETGTGKEVLARGLHAQSQRPGAFVAVNCGAIPQNLVESQLFGHTRGAFSGAVRDEPGLVRSAHGGTLLLDEIGDLPASSQTALLRVLQEGEVLPVGSAQTAKVDVRIIAATHMPLEDLIARNVFRRDLYARLMGYRFTLPPLRDRLVDLGLIVPALLGAGRLGARPGVRIQNDALRALLHHSWPMNIRELEQCLAAACVLAEDDVITASDLPVGIGAADEVKSSPESDAPAPDRRTVIMSLLAKHEGNLSAVARELRTSRTQVYRLMERYGLADKA